MPPMVLKLEEAVLSNCHSEPSELSLRGVGEIIRS